MTPFGQNVLLYDWAGKPTQSDTSAAPLTNRPGSALYTVGGTASQGGILALGSDYGSTPKAQVPRVDANGVLTTVSSTAAVSGSAVTTPTGPICMGVSSGVARPLQQDALQNLVVVEAQQATFTSVITGVALSTGKSLFALVNGSTAGTVLRLAALYVANTGTSTALTSTFNIYAGELRPITTVQASTGTAGVILAHDSADTLDANVKTYTGATVNGDTQGALRRWITSNYGLTPNATDAEAQNSEQQNRFPWSGFLGGLTKPIVVRPGAGLHVKVASTATAGYVDVTCIFTQAAA